MKPKFIGVMILAAAVAASGLFMMFSGNSQTATLSGYLGGEKIGLFEDEEIADYIRKNYHLQFDYSRAGSLDMVTADQLGRDYLFPSSQTAQQYFNAVHGSPAAEEIVFNTPIVLYSHKMVADALAAQGIVSQTDGVYYSDMVKLTELILAGKQWSDIGLPQLFGSVCVDTTDPARSNSGNMFASLLANSLNGGKTVDDEAIYHILPDLKKIFAQTGYMETSSSDLFNQFLRMGVGAKPIIVGYESQLLEYAAEYPDDYAKVSGDIVVIYPTPTVWSAHVYIALDEDGKAGIEALTDPEVQRLAWEKHGFRTSSSGVVSGEITVSGIPENITSVMNIPTYSVMKQIIDELS